LIVAVVALVLACDCPKGPTHLHEALTKAQKSATAIFRGKVTKVSGEWPKSRTVELQVLETFKGKLGPTVIIATVAPREVSRPEDDKGCQPSFDELSEYLVYADGKLGALTASICNRNQFISPRLAPELDFLRGKPLPPEPKALLRKLPNGQWGPIEKLGASTPCEWKAINAPTCELPQAAELWPDVPKGTPGLWCTPLKAPNHLCRWVPDVTATN
jgi:hypothetical protein